MSKKFLIPETLAQVILDYLAGRPYREVFKMVTALQTLPELPQANVDAWLTQYEADDAPDL